MVPKYLALDDQSISCPSAVIFSLGNALGARRRVKKTTSVLMGFSLSFQWRTNLTNLSTAFCKFFLIDAALLFVVSNATSSAYWAVIQLQKLGKSAKNILNSVGLRQTPYGTPACFALPLKIAAIFHSFVLLL